MRNKKEDYPQGQVTFLFTDLVDSTKLWEIFPEAMHEALARHDALLKEVVTAFQGWTVKTTGNPAADLDRPWGHGQNAPRLADGGRIPGRIRGRCILRGPYRGERRYPGPQQHCRSVRRKRIKIRADPGNAQTVP